MNDSLKGSIKPFFIAIGTFCTTGITLTAQLKRKCILQYFVGKYDASLLVSCPQVRIPDNHKFFALGLVSSSVTRLGDLLHFGQLFKACGNNYFALIAQIFRQF